ncbi:hypothetical protein, partial [Lacticaseibacillus porcinae]|uniref:hypothetical protein n=1 Tax=Lacticaseibacillus porcinae TaxID=1123687 RepID=UPI001CDBB372
FDSTRTAGGFEARAFSARTRLKPAQSKKRSEIFRIAFLVSVVGFDDNLRQGTTNPRNSILLRGFTAFMPFNYVSTVSHNLKDVAAGLGLLDLNRVRC